MSLTDGPVGGRLFRFVIPILAGNILQQLYNSIDAMIIGRYVGENALGAIGVSQPIINVILALVIGLGIGEEILLGQYVGCRDERRIKQVFDTLFTSIMALSFLVAICGYFATPFLLRLIRTQPSQIEAAAAYLKIVFLGIPGIAGYNTMSGAIRASGNSKAPLCFLLICTLLNGGLDLLMVKGLNMGVHGAAIATVVAQMVSFILCILYVNSAYPILRYHIRKLDFSTTMLRRGAKCAIPASIQQCAVSVGMLLLQVVINDLGPSAVTAYTIGSRIDSFASAPIINIGQALGIFTSQNLGAGKIERVREAKKYCLLWAYIVGGTLFVLLWGFGDSIARFFGAEGETVDMAKHYVQVLSSGYFIAGYFTVVEGLIRGTGNTLVPMASAISGYWIIRLPAAVLMKNILGYWGVWLSVPTGWLFEFLLILCYYHSKRFQHSIDVWSLRKESAYEQRMG